MNTTISQKDFSSLFNKIPKKKGKIIGNPPKVQQMPFNPRKGNKI
jgi:hypothetical protein